MLKTSLFLPIALGLALVPSVSQAIVHTTIVSSKLITATNLNFDGTGIWFNPLTGYSEQRGATYPSPLYEDGKFFLTLYGYTTPEASVVIEGLISRGNNVLDNSSQNPLRFSDGASIGSASGFTYSGGGYTDLGPTYGNWLGGGHGYLGLVMRDPSSASSSDVFYGYAEINVDPSSYAISLLSFAYNDVRGQSITTVSTVPEPSVLALAPLGLAAWTLARRRKSFFDATIR